MRVLSDKLVFDYSTSKTLLIKLSGDWHISAGLLSESEVTSELASHPDIVQINFSVSQELKWDSGLIAFLLRLIRECERKKIKVAREGLPPEAQKLLTLALKVTEKTITPQKAHKSFFEEIGEKVLQMGESFNLAFNFLGDIAVSLAVWLRVNLIFVGMILCSLSRDAGSIPCCLFL